MIAIRILIYTGARKNIANTFKHNWVSKRVKIGKMTIKEFIPFRKLIYKLFGNISEATK
jgi:hypothetical protein